jgi:hypothetical protein
MKKARLFSLVLIAIFALGAMLASSASAIPKFKLPITKRNFTAESGTSTFNDTSANDTITCPSSTSNGTILGDDEISVDIHYNNCTIRAGTKGTCSIKSVGAPGTSLIETKLLTGLLGLLHQPNGAAGILFEPAKGNVFVTFSPTSAPCSTPTEAVEGSVAGEFTPTGKSTKTALISADVTNGGTGKQVITLILTLKGIVNPELISFGAAVSTQLQDAVVTFEENVEVD